MNGHSAEERNALLLGTRTSGGGFSPSEALGAVLSYLHDEGEAASTGILWKVIREEKHIAYNDKRVLEVWGSWDDFCTAIIEVLAEGGFITRSPEGNWVLGENAIPGKQLQYFRDRANNKMRGTFFGKNKRVIRDAIGEARTRIENLIYWLQSVRDLDPALGKVHGIQVGASAVLQDALRAPEEKPPAAEQGKKQEEQEESPPRGGIGKKRPDGMIQRFIFGYLRDNAGRPVSIQEMTHAFNAHDRENIYSGKYKAIHTGVVNQAVDKMHRVEPDCTLLWVRPPEVDHVSVLYEPGPGSGEPYRDKASERPPKPVFHPDEERQCTICGQFKSKQDDFLTEWAADHWSTRRQCEECRGKRR
jgi:hypothetical protein